jgi:tetratricopeptide (TPR) repeat protein
MLAGMLAACASAAPSPAMPASTARPTLTYEERVQMAQSLVDSGRVERALDLLQSAAAEAPERPEAYVVWGRALAVKNDLKASAETYEKARRLGSRDRRLFVELSSVYDVSEAYEQSIAVYLDWLGKSPDDAEMHHELGLTLLLVGRLDEAVAHLGRASEIEPRDLQAREDYGYALLRLGRLEEAASSLEAVLQLDPRRADALRYLAQVRAAQGRSDDALGLLDRALLAAPDDARAARVRARLRQLLGDQEHALDDYDLVLRQAPDDVAALLGAAGALLALERLDEAAPLLARVRAANKDLPELKMRESQLAWRRGDRKAVAELQKLTQAQANNLELWRDLAAAAKRFGDKKLLLDAEKQLKSSETRP